MKRNRAGISAVAGLLLMCAAASGCREGDPLGDVEKWTFTQRAGYIKNVSEQGQFDSFVGEFLTDSQWEEIKPYSNRDDDNESLNVTWYGVITWMTKHHASTEKIDMLKEKLASYEWAVYFYKMWDTTQNNSYKYHWVRFVKN